MSSSVLYYDSVMASFLSHALQSTSTVHPLTRLKLYSSFIIHRSSSITHHSLSIIPCTISTRSLQSLLYRDYIQSLLYSTNGFFNLPNLIKHIKPIRFPSLYHETHYRQIVDRHYDHCQFLTPVEVFKPTYADAVLTYILECYDEKEGPLNSILDDG